MTEAERRLSPTLAYRLMEAGVFRMGVPRAYNGYEIDPLGQVRVVEELSRISGSVGWLSMISVRGQFTRRVLRTRNCNASVRWCRKRSGGNDTAAAAS